LTVPIKEPPLQFATATEILWLGSQIIPGRQWRHGNRHMFIMRCTTIQHIYRMLKLQCA